MDAARLNVENTTLAIDSHAAGLFGKKRHRVGFVQQAKFALRVRFRWWVSRSHRWILCHDRLASDDVVSEFGHDHKAFLFR